MLRDSLRRLKESLAQQRSRPWIEIVKRLRRKYRGYLNYYGVRGNPPALVRYWHECQRISFGWLNRRKPAPELHVAGVQQDVAEDCPAASPDRGRTVPPGRPKPILACMNSVGFDPLRDCSEDPIAENRTQGSARGLPGSGPSCIKKNYQRLTAGDRSGTSLDLLGLFFRLTSPFP